MNIAVVGSFGYIAKYLIEMLQSKKNINKIYKIDQFDEADIKIDLSNASDYEYSFLENVDFVIFTAAISGPDKCASDFDFCWNINVTGTKYFINEALKYNCKVLFFSSDAVFGRDTGIAFDENSETHAFTPYGIMKKNIEDSFSSNKNFKAIRLSYVSSANDKFINYCISCIKNDEIADVFHPFYRNNIVISDVVKTVSWMIDNWNQYKHTFLNLAGLELISRIRVADELNRNLAGKLKYIVSKPKDEFFINRPKITQMKSLYLYELNIIDNRMFSEKIKAELKEIKL